VLNSKLGRILHCFGDTAAYMSKNRKNRPFEPTLENFSTSHTSPESEIMGLSDGEEIMTF